ncbi:hypothetical protein [Streptomyces sp. NPDC003327]
MTTLYTTPSGIGRHRQAVPQAEGHPAARLEESVPHQSKTLPPGPPQTQAVPVPPTPHSPHVPPASHAPHVPPAPVPPVPVPVQVPADPPIYKAVLSLWASQGRTLPGHRDQEWSRLAAGPVWANRTVRVSGTLVRRGDGR